MEIKMRVPTGCRVAIQGKGIMKLFNKLFYRTTTKTFPALETCLTTKDEGDGIMSYECKMRTVEVGTPDAKIMIVSYQEPRWLFKLFKRKEKEAGEIIDTVFRG